MDTFLERLAERKYGLYHALYIAIPQANTSDECYDRIVRKAKYIEILDLINWLPLNEQRIVEKRFNEMKI
jgi:hypothetical protein